MIGSRRANAGGREGGTGLGGGGRAQAVVGGAGALLAVTLLVGCRVGYDANQLHGNVDIFAGLDASADGGGGGWDGAGDDTNADASADAGFDGGPPDVGAPPACGDGAINQASEACDDGNTEPGDGCDARCAVEQYWSCQGAPSRCVPICGDGIIVRVPGDPEKDQDPVGQAGLPCDDGNALSGDGCDETCHTEEGWTCETVMPLGGDPRGDGAGAQGADAAQPGVPVQGPSVCHGTCGDGFVTADEECDLGLSVTPADGGPSGGATPAPWEETGCDDACRVMEWWTCVTTPEHTSECHTDCGDGFVLLPYEVCDDGNGQPGDGCDMNCQVEEHWECTPLSPSSCQPICGDGYAVPGLEACDDGNDVSGDGCDPACVPEEGWDCGPVDESGTDVQCNPICGDGLIVGPEECDDGPDGDPDNPWSGPNDGCDVCTVVDGWTCDPNTTEKHDCKPLCGDGNVMKLSGPLEYLSEQCDDDNNEPGDGCSPDCKKEQGWSCGHLTGKPSVCVSSCGDGYWVGEEGCDDGNTLPGDGCDADCQVEAGWQCAGEPGGASQCSIWCIDGDGDGYGVGAHCPNPGVDCDDSSAAAYPGDHPELCDGVDNDCDGLTDAVVCGDSDEGVCQPGVAYCLPGQSATDVPGGPCVGKIGASPVELCNGLDDTCDGHVDAAALGDQTFASPLQTCGFGVCAVTTAVCAGGALVGCRPDWDQVGQEECDGVDNDCDGLTDEACVGSPDVPDCVWVAGPDAVRALWAEEGTWRNPYASVQDAIQEASSSAPARDVCVLGAVGCDLNPEEPPPVLTAPMELGGAGGDIQMANGVSVLGGFAPDIDGPSAQSEGCGAVLVVSGPLGVHFDGVTSPTMLQGLRVRSDYVPGMSGGGGPGGEWVAAVTVDDSPGAVISDCWISGSPNATASAGVLVRGGAAAGTGPILRANRILGGGTVQSAGVRSEGARPRIEGSCDHERVDKDGRCTGTCDPSQPGSYSKRLILGGLASLEAGGGVAETAVGVWLVGSPGAHVSRSVVCGFGSDTAEGVRIEGSAQGTIISTSSVAAAGGAVHDAGVHAKGCAGSRPRLLGNTVLGAGGSMGDSGPIASATYGVWMQAGCHGIVEGNQLIAGLMSGRAQLTAGIYCDPSGGGAPPGCLISRNQGIVGHSTQELLGADGQLLVAGSYGVKCEAGACRAIVQNGIIAGGAAGDTRGVLLAQSDGVLVDGNLIWPGCATESAYGVEAVGALARLQNNVVVATGEGCLGVDLDNQGTQWVALHTTTEPSAAEGAELDVHSNLLFAAGHLVQAALCQATAVFTSNPGGSSGVYRNNILGAGVCSERVGVFASQEGGQQGGGGARYLGYNAFEPSASAYWMGQSGQVFATASQLDTSDPVASGGSGPVRFEHNLGVPVDFQDTGGSGSLTPPALDPGSPLVDHGTAAGAPKWDIEGEPRPAGAGFDIGADEVH